MVKGRMEQFRWFLDQVMKSNSNKHMVIFMLNWTVVSLCYYLILFRLTHLHGNMYLNGISSSLAEFCGNIIIGAFLVHFGLKQTLIGSFTFMALSSIVYLFPILTLDIWYALILFVLKLSLTCAFASVFYGTNSLFREDLVPVIFALCNLLARLMTMAAPLISMQYEQDTTTMAVFLGLSLLGMMCSGFITEKKRSSSSSSGGDSHQKKRKKDKRKKKR